MSKKGTRRAAAPDHDGPASLDRPPPTPTTTEDRADQFEEVNVEPGEREPPPAPPSSSMARSLDDITGPMPKPPPAEVELPSDFTDADVKRFQELCGAVEHFLKPLGPSWARTMALQHIVGTENYGLIVLGRAVKPTTRPVGREYPNWRGGR
jgi:hypothetical protein